MFFKQAVNRNITRIMSKTANSQLNTIRNMNTNTNISNEVLNKKLDYIIDTVTSIQFGMIGIVSFGAGYGTTLLICNLILNK
jgi:hypothetical protein